MWFDASEYVTSSVDVLNRYRARIDAHLAAGSMVALTASAAIDASAAVVTIDVTVPPGDPASYAARAILYEETATYCCDPLGNDTFRHVGRALSAAEPIALRGTGRSASAIVTIPIDTAWGPEDLRVVAFVEDAATGFVVNAAPAETASAMEPAGWGRIKALYR